MGSQSSGLTRSMPIYVDMGRTSPLSEAEWRTETKQHECLLGWPSLLGRCLNCQTSRSLAREVVVHPGGQNNDAGWTLCENAVSGMGGIDLVRGSDPGLAVR